jgi:hypothetical protein
MRTWLISYGAWAMKFITNFSVILKRSFSTEYVIRAVHKTNPAEAALNF